MAKGSKVRWCWRWCLLQDWVVVSSSQDSGGRSRSEAHVMVRSHSPEVSERASEQRDAAVAGTEDLNGGRRHACAAGSGKQASTSTHTSQLQTHPPYYLWICHTIFSKASRVPDQLAMVLPRFPRMLHFDWLESEFWSVRGRERDRWRS